MIGFGDPVFDLRVGVTKAPVASALSTGKSKTARRPAPIPTSGTAPASTAHALPGFTAARGYRRRIEGRRAKARRAGKRHPSARSGDRDSGQAPIARRLSRGLFRHPRAGRWRHQGSGGAFVGADHSRASRLPMMTACSQQVTWRSSSSTPTGSCLSACNTIAGDKPGAEALSGLARAFFYAGARALLVSHWAVESNAATLLTTVDLRHHEVRPEAWPRRGAAPCHARLHERHVQPPQRIPGLLGTVRGGG